LDTKPGINTARQAAILHAWQNERAELLRQLENSRAFFWGLLQAEQEQE
jgi:hypothetical protein